MEIHDRRKRNDMYSQHSRKGEVRTGVGALVESLCSDANFPAVPLASFAGGSGLNISSGHRVLFRPGWSASQGARTSAPVA